MSALLAEMAVVPVGTRRHRAAPGDRAVAAVGAVAFALAATGTFVWCRSMSDMAGMPMPGGWTMSMTWMRMPRGTWLGSGAAFVGMWSVMMVAMMLPSLVPMLLAYRAAVAAPGDARLGGLTALVGAGYFSVWTVVGVVVFPAGVAVTALTMASPAFSRLAPTAAGVVVAVSGLWQCSASKARRLACCRGEIGAARALGADPASAWRHGLALGRECVHCCAALTAVLLVGGVMDLGVMAAVTTAITAERLVPIGVGVARLVGAALVALGVVLLIRGVTTL